MPTSDLPFSNSQFGSIPTKNDWGDIDRHDLDASYAYKRFFGKTLAQVLPYFEDAVLEAAEDLRYMPAIPFRYYIFAFKEFLLSEKAMSSEGNCIEVTGGADVFLNLIHDKLTNFPSHIVSVMFELMPVVEFIAMNQDLYGAPVSIYGSFPERLREIRQLYEAAGPD
jgi:hypothetical protein